MNKKAQKLVEHLLEDELAIQCAWCKKIKQPDGSYAAGTPPPNMRISHSICPDCKEREMGQMRQQQQQPQSRQSVPPPKASFYPSMGGPSNA